ncbi:monosaccharide ABC transporter membrane protein (CUT2 family) [Asanoa ferruginea]|uniref:Monosaccharide ABC transporter membrane protein (CUT2 family) n=1 Tax=Asanoa ferruginea TaxID=53367 RepID=A0A3D9ZVK9_9ACTN|nr:ABC transporter permease [Asanoa ferruginea]REG01208.1 monosaccharide ABC transporter membrane protein (CUT2 family) [Asanoa ferruginea]GIF47082.1 sugar ABC transporter permease [Asanoa ferruginea]
MREALRRASLGYLVLAATVVAYLVVYTSRLGRFPTSFDYLSILNTTLPLVFVAIGQSLVVLTGGIDLSVGGIVSVCVAVTASRVTGGVLSSYTWIVVIIAMGAACGAVNGLIVAYGRIAPILTTLATLSIFSGLALWVLPVPGGSIPPEVRLVLTNPGTPTGLIWLGLAVVGWLVLRRTRFGMRVYAVGSDESSARAVGVPAAAVKLKVYALSGLCSALAAVFYVSTTTAGDANAGNPFILTSIASVVVGGVAFSGGRGSALGAVAGAVALTLVIDILFFSGIDPLYQSLFQGLFLVVAVLLGTVAALVARRRRLA